MKRYMVKVSTGKKSEYLYIYAPDKNVLLKDFREYLSDYQAEKLKKSLGTMENLHVEVWP